MIRKASFNFFGLFAMAVILIILPWRIPYTIGPCLAINTLIDEVSIDGTKDCKFTAWIDRDVRPVEVVVTDTQTGIQRRFPTVSESTAVYEGLKFSPEAHYIAYIGSDDPTELISIYSNIYIINLVTGKTRQLTHATRCHYDYLMWSKEWLLMSQDNCSSPDYTFTNVLFTISH